MRTLGWTLLIAAVIAVTPSASALEIADGVPPAGAEFCAARPARGLDVSVGVSSVSAAATGADVCVWASRSTETGDRRRYVQERGCTRTASFRHDALGTYARVHDRFPTTVTTQLSVLVDGHWMPVQQDTAQASATVDVVWIARDGEPDVRVGRMYYWVPFVWPSPGIDRASDVSGSVYLGGHNEIVRLAGSDHATITVGT